MNIVVCMKVVPRMDDVRLDPVTRTLDRSGAQNEINEPDKNALEMALQLKDRHGGRVTVLSMGPPFFDPFLRLAVSMGADDAVLLSDRSLAGADTLATSYALARAVARIGDADLVLCGEESSDASTAQVPPGIAEWLGWSQVLYVSELLPMDDGRIRARRTIRGGYEVVAVRTPLVASVELGVNSPRFPDFRRKRWADREFQPTVWDAAAVGAEPELIGAQGSRSIVTELVEKSRPDRRRERVEGTAEEQAERLFGAIVECLG